jgi:peptidoglycan-associated lipoprotein
LFSHYPDKVLIGSPIREGSEKLSFGIILAAWTTMRATLTATVLISALLAGCASTNDGPANKNISQTGALKVHPGLLGQPVPAELQQDMRPAVVQPAPGASETPMKLDEAGLRTQRSVYFDYNSSTVKADFDPALKAHARYLASNPKARVRIDGNADERGPAGYNNILGLKRADNVRQSIIGHGAPEKQVVVKSLGESKPKLKGHDEESWAENRRADVVYERDE